MEKLLFKTNINCSGCIEKATPFFNGEQRIREWSVNTAVPEKLLTVVTEGIGKEEVLDLLKTAGFRGEVMH